MYQSKRRDLSLKPDRFYYFRKIVLNVDFIMVIHIKFPNKLYNIIKTSAILIKKQSILLVLTPNF